MSEERGWRVGCKKLLRSRVTGWAWRRVIQGWVVSVETGGTPDYHDARETADGRGRHVPRREPTTTVPADALPPLVLRSSRRRHSLPLETQAGKRQLVYG